ncbi:MAG: hypothetical protein LBC60_03890 [Spirochaetaceae bacterium]|jgi:hypothetical protein|nr:hypothetical protein [Spirochaetaceae bacterium]
MAEDVSLFGSDSWIADINELCFDYLKNLQKRPGGRFLRFRDELLGTKAKPGPIIQEYHSSVTKAKMEIYGKNARDAHIDYHKIAALYIRSFLIHCPFISDIPNETKYYEVCLYVKLANEYFSIPFLAAVFKAWNHDCERALRMEPIYKDNFIKLLYRFKKDPDKLDYASLANMIYLIEQRYFL